MSTSHCELLIRTGNGWTPCCVLPRRAVQREVRRRRLRDGEWIVEPAAEQERAEERILQPEPDEGEATCHGDTYR